MAKLPPSALTDAAVGADASTVVESAWSGDDSRGFERDLHGKTRGYGSSRAAKKGNRPAAYPAPAPHPAPYKNARTGRE